MSDKLTIAINQEIMLKKMSVKISAFKFIL